ncbi:MAG: DUF1294 domain-containing protein [Epulopiscium sp.]|nr:DUF1294 domain-containing protein [Candidatus Epulonipiscium sp.]
MDFFIALLITNFISYIIFGIDKTKAEKKEWRISEKTLIFSSLFGPLGAFIAMYTFNHKTKKLKFNILVPLLGIVQLSIIIYIYTAY